MMKRFSAPAPLSVSLIASAVLALVLGLAMPASAQRPLVEDEFKPIPSGPGIQVCEPVAPEGQEALAEFGSGCGLWLQWAMGFHPELGQTPRWETAIRAAQELHTPRLRLSLAQGSKLYNILGITHVAVGKITGTPAKCLLSYQLYALPEEKAVGAPIKLVGSAAQVITELPQAAQTLLSGLGVPKAHVPAGVGATPAELMAIGHYDWYGDLSAPEAEQARMDALGKRLPLAALLSIVHHNVGTDTEKEAVARRIITQASGNFLMLGAAVTSVGHSSEEFARSVSDRMALPGGANNSVMAYWTISKAQTYDDAVKATERLVRLAPRSAAAWDFLAREYSAQAESVRMGRVHASLSARDLEKIKPIYYRGLVAALRSTALDPDNADAWLDLSTAALFAEEPEQAHTVYWKALELNPSSTRIYNWGLEMFQPKWSGDRESLAKVAHMTTTAVFPPTADLYALGAELQSAKFPDEAKALYDRAITQARETVRQHPNDATAHAMLGYELKGLRQLPEAETELKAALRLDPTSHIGLYQLSQLYSSQGRYVEAAVPLREYVRITKDDDEKKNLAELLLYAVKTDQLDEPEQMLREVEKAWPAWYQPHEDLGWILTHKKEYDAALAEYTLASRITADASLPHREMGEIYRLQSKYDEAIREGEFAMALEPRNFLVLNSLAESYAAKGDYDASVKTYQQSLAIASGIGSSYLGLSKVYLKMGKKDEARATLTRAQKAYLTPEEKTALQELLDKNP